MLMVLTDLDPKACRFLEMKQERGKLLWKALDGLNLQIFDNTSPCPVNKKPNPATCPAPNMLNITLKAQNS